VTSADESGCALVIPDIGILGTPVIDPATGTIYLVTNTKPRAARLFHQRLHALLLLREMKSLAGQRKSGQWSRELEPEAVETG